MASSKSRPPPSPSKNDKTRRIRVGNLPRDCSDDMLVNYFENKRSFDGIELDVVSVELFGDHAILTFKDDYEAELVVSKHSRHPCTLNNQKLEIELYSGIVIVKEDKMEEQTPTYEDDVTTTVEVRGFKGSTTDDTIMLYFENKRRSGGGEMETFTVDRDKKYAHIVFKDKTSAAIVLAKSHTIEGCPLTVKRFIASKTELLLTGIPESVTTESLENFIEAKLKMEAVHVVYGEDKSRAIVKFETEIDFEEAAKVCETYPLGGVHLLPGRVPTTDCIIVTNLPDGATDDTFRYYFENPRRSHGGEVENVEIKEDDGYCLVYFKDIQVMEAVCRKQDHKLQNMKLNVQAFHNCLGPTTDSGESKFNIPEPIDLIDIDPYKMKFLMRTPSKKEKLENELEHCHAKIIWQDQPIRIACLLSKSINKYKTLAKTWKDKAMNTLNEFTRDLVIKKRKVSEESWDDTITELGTLNTPHPDEISVILERNNQLVLVVAHIKAIELAWQEIERMIEHVEKYTKEQKEMVNEEKNLDQWKIRYLHAVGYVDDMRQLYKKLNITMDTTTHKINFKGPKSEVTAAQLNMHEYLTDVKMRKLHVGKENAQLLRHKSTNEIISNRMRDTRLTDVWEVSGEYLVMHGNKESDLDKMEHIVWKGIAKISIDLDSKSNEIISSQEWKHTENNIKEQFVGCVVIKVTKQPDRLEIFTLAEIKDEIFDKCKDFMSKNTLYKEQMTLGPCVARFIKTHMKPDLDREVDEVQKRGIRLSIKFELGGTVTFEGTSEGLKAAKTIVYELKSRVQSRQHVSKHPGIQNYIASPKGCECIKTVEETTRCVIEVLGSGPERRHTVLASRFDRPTTCAETTLPSGVKIVVVGGDITSLNVDVIVNAANTEMKHVGGLAAVIVKKGGKSIQDECDNRIQNKGKLAVGDVFLSTAGHLSPCKAIAHAVGPTWAGGMKGEERLLETAVRKCLEKCEKRSYVSLALPALSAGMFRYPVDQSCAVIIKTIHKHFKGRNSFMKKVYLCDISEATVQAFIDALQKRIDKVKVLVKLNLGERKPKQTFVPDVDYPDDTVDDDHADNGQFGKVNVKLVKAILAKERVDVIVNSTSPDLQLSKGVSSKSLLRAAGDEIQQECDSTYPQGISVGDVATSKGGNLKCQQVFHIALQQYNGDMQGFNACMEACLEEAHKRRYTSISFPAMGTGAQKYPKDKVASEMYGSIAKFCRRHPNTAINKVRIVIFTEDDDTFEAFLTEEINWTAPDHRDSSTDHRAKDHGYAASGIGKVIHVSKDQAEFQIGHLKVLIGQGDITDEDTVAIVASGNRELDLTKGAVTKAIVMKGGAEVVKDCNTQVSTMQKQGMIVTTAGQLLSKYIIHVETKRKTSEWQSVILACLQLAEKHNMTSLAFPALGTSVGCKPGDIAEVMVAAMVEYLKHKPKNVQEIRIVVFKKAMISPFIDGIRASVEGTGGRGQSGDQHVLESRASRNSQYSSTRTQDGADTCRVTIFTDIPEHIDKAIKQFETTVKSEWHTKEIQDHGVHALQQKQIEEIKKKAKDKHVHVEIDPDMGIIKLQGLLQNIMPVNDMVTVAIRVQEKSIYERRHAQLMKNIVTWVYVKNQKEIPFPDNDNLAIETAFKRNDTTVRIRDKSGRVFEINFASKQEFDIKQPQTQFPVLRKDIASDAGTDIPKVWGKMAGQNLKLVKLTVGSQEYNNVVAEFTKTLGRQPQIIQIERVQNVTLYTQYVAKRKQMMVDNAHRKDNERILWHGTAPATIPSINALGFNRSFCAGGIQGVYFATNASYSDGGYASPDASGHKRMYRTLVLTGDFTLGNGGRTPPPKNPAQPHILFDSVVDNMASPVMYIICNDTQAYPEHLITYV